MMMGALSANGEDPDPVHAIGENKVKASQLSITLYKIYPHLKVQN